MDILFQDDALIAVHKPAGLLVHRSLIDTGASTFALQLVRDLIGQWVYPVHRLDRPTSGVLLFARNPETARALTAQFSASRVSKTYHAIVRGWTQPAGTIDHALREEPDRITDALADPDKPPQRAVTGYRRLAQVELPFPVGRYPSARYSLLELQPETGRRHQLRRHLKHIFHPIIGDTTHGDGRHNQFFRDRFGNQRLLLVATRLCLDHPATGQRLVIEAPPAEDFAHMARALGWNLSDRFKSSAF
ncbi:tRNA pseudouridine(65) synthase TruC [Rhabdochromatium marinum]|uniref:tRNA pseudouridine(65) synthase TruC n=1 Tax=Rhabdochromatium marinum TaxID=48729 RepID=UPI0019075AFF|nr:tRNA pseudouridine(65) synthase TruC [Rhabdochromatium marinum]MBK1650214.1 tRNA pseudouridine(65) synthase TruC [Rhabdochromatium marinum]